MIVDKKWIFNPFLIHVIYPILIPLKVPLNHIKYIEFPWKNPTNMPVYPMKNPVVVPADPSDSPLTVRIPAKGRCFEDDSDSPTASKICLNSLNEYE